MSSHDTYHRSTKNVEYKKYDYRDDIEDKHEDQRKTGMMRTVMIMTMMNHDDLLARARSGRKPSLQKSGVRLPRNSVAKPP